jgi:hypothetical protein
MQYRNDFFVRLFILSVKRKCKQTQQYTCSYDSDHSRNKLKIRTAKVIIILFHACKFLNIFPKNTNFG